MSSTPKKITELSPLTTSLDDDVIVIVDIAEDETKKQTKGNFLHEIQGDIDDHIDDTNNPHSVTPSQIGALSGVITATGTIDDSNIRFVFQQKPLLVCINGAMYRENKGWSWELSTLTAILTFPVGFNGDIFGII